MIEAVGPHGEISKKNPHKIKYSTLQKCGFVFRYTALCRHVLASPLPTVYRFQQREICFAGKSIQMGKNISTALLLQSINAESDLFPRKN